MCDILVVDDEKGFASDVRDALLSDRDRPDYNVVEAHTFDDAVHAINGTDFDVVVVDVSLSTTCEPNTRGLELLEYVRDLRPHAKVIVMTQFGQLNAGPRAMRLGAFAFVFKHWPGVDAVTLVKEQVKLALDCLDAGVDNAHAAA